MTQCSLRAVAFLLFIGISNPSFAQSSLPAEYVGAWGDEETCLAYHRGDLYWELRADGRFLIKGYDAYSPTYAFRLRDSTSTGATLISTPIASQSLTIRHEGNAFRMEYASDAGDRLFLHKCDVADMVMGIGRDPANVTGDLGIARHITFTFGYATAAASMCGRQIDGQTTLTILEIGREAAQRYAIAIEALPPESWAKRLAERRVPEGGRAAELDAEVIPDFCSWVEKAYGQDGWVVDGLYKSE